MEVSEGRAAPPSAELIATVARLVRLLAPLDRRLEVEMHDAARRLEAIARRSRGGDADGESAEGHQGAPAW